jgi:hypothetical protein
MSSFRIFAIAATISAAMAAPALAQSNPSDSMPDQGAAAADQPTGAVNNGPGDTSMAPSAGASGANASGLTTSQSTTDQNGATVVNTTVTNGPVPDTAQNRARFGAPMSNAGKRTAPAGN